MSSTAVCALCAAFLAADPTPSDPPPRIQLAILLDTSNSMDGLISQAKSQLWKIVNEFSHSKKDGRTPVLEVALYEYGKSALSPATGYIRQILPFTVELDKVSEQLFSLTTNGGDEYCGMVIERAVQELVWSNQPGDLKAIYIAGNEPFTQGPVDYHNACRAAIGRGVSVNTIHCGDLQAGRNSGWQEGARIAEGAFANIDQNKALVAITTPFDAQIVKLGTEINETYIAYGVEGAIGRQNQYRQDANASRAASSESIVQRSLFKSNANYRNSSWDLVDAVRDGRLKIGELKVELLPREMQTMPPEKWKVHIESQHRRRSEIQKQIVDLQVQRERYIADQQKNAGGPKDASLDSAIIEGLRNRAEKKGWKFDRP